MYTSDQFAGGGTSIQASRAFRAARGKPGNLGMLTVYGYGFEEPAPPGPPPTPWGTYLLVAAAGWWAWTKWGGKLGVAARKANPRRRRVVYRRRRNTSVRELSMGGVERHGEHVAITREHGAYLVKRHPGHPAGHRIEGRRTLSAARSLARKMRAERGN